MKRNAIIRIIIWSVVLVLLISILGTVLLGRSVRRSRAAVEATLVPATEDYTRPENAITGTVAEALNIRSAPNESASSVGMLVPGDTVDITRQESVNGHIWGYIVSPLHGWICMDFVTTGNAEETIVSDNTAASADDTETEITSIAETYVEVTVPESVAASPAVTIPELEIEWVAGHILIQASDVDDIMIESSEPADPKYVTLVKRTANKISVEFCDEDLLEWGFGTKDFENVSKDLTILVPTNWSLGDLDVDAAAATMQVKNLTIREVEFDGASGTCDFENCVVDQLELDTASGDVTFTGTLKVLDCDAASANVEAILDNVPSRIDMDSMSGDLKLTLPDWAGFTLSMDGMSSNFVCEFDYSQKRDGTFVSGDGSCRIDMDAMSGDVYIHKNTAAAAIPQETSAP